MGAPPLKNTTRDATPIPEGVPLFAHQARRVLSVNAETLRAWTAADRIPHIHLGKVKVKYPCAADLREWFKSEAFSNVK
jgi:hypothetical protein